MEIIDVNEINAIWFDDPTKYGYVRKIESMAYSPNFKGKFSRGSKCIGYTKPIRRDGGIIFYKFLFYLKSYDRGMSKEGLVYGKANSKQRFGKHWKLYRPTEAVKITNKQNLIFDNKN